MPEPITTLTVGAIALYLADKIAGKAIGDSSAALWGKVKQWFKGDEVLSILEKAPDSATQKDLLAAKLDELIKQQPETLKEIESLLNQLPYGMVSNVADITGIGNLAFQNITNSTINASITINQSGEYIDFLDQLKTKKRLLALLPESERTERLQTSGEINDLEQKVERFKEEVLRLAETFDKIELNTERLQKAKEYFDKGELTEARVLLEDAEEERADFVTHALGKQKDYEEKILPGLRNAAAEYLILAQATALDFENPNRFENTRLYYEQSIAALESVDNLFAYAYFLQIHLQYEEAVDVYERIKREFASSLNPEAYAGTLNNLAISHSLNNEHEAAEREFGEALEIRRRLAEKNPKAYLPAVAMTLNNLANLHVDRDENEVAEAEYREAHKLYRKLAEKNSQTYLPYVAATLNNLAGVYYARNEYEEVEKVAGEALEIYRELTEKDPQTYLPDLAMTLRNFAIFYQESKPDKVRSIELALEVIKVLVPFVERVPITQEYFAGAVAVLKDWGMSEEEILAEIADDERIKEGA